MMIKALSIAALAAVVAGAPAAANAADPGMAAMQYYVGNWNCTAGPAGQPAQNATAIYTMDNGVLRGWVNVPAQGAMTSAYVFQSAIGWDAKAGRYVQTTMDNMGAWTASSASPWMGNTEAWTDIATSDNKPARGSNTRTDANSFSFLSYSSPTSDQVVFKGSCTRSGS